MTSIVKAFRNCQRRRRVYNIVIFIAIACALILCFQFFLFGAITIYQDEQTGASRFDRGARPKFFDDEFGFEMGRIASRTDRPIANVKIKTTMATEKCVGSSCNENSTAGKKDIVLLQHELNVTVVKNKHFKNSIISYTDVWLLLEHEFSVDHVNGVDVQLNTTNIRGINARWRDLYRNNKSGLFTCIMSHVRNLCFYFMNRTG